MNYITEKYEKTENYKDEASGLEIADAYRVGVRVSFDLLNGLITVEESVFASVEAFEAQASPVKANDSFLIQGEDFADLDKKSKTLFHALKNVFLFAAERRAAAQAATTDKQKEKFKDLIDVIEKAGGRVLFPDDEAKEGEK